MNKIYVYEGPVFHFENIVTENFKEFTAAPSEKKALANITYKAKTKFKYTSNANITLDPKCLKISGE